MRFRFFVSVRMPMRLTEECPIKTSFFEESIAAWNGSSKEFPAAGPPIFRRRTAGTRETVRSRPWRSLKPNYERSPETTSDRKEVYGRLTSAVARLASLALDLTIPVVEFLLRDDFSRIGKELAVNARHFDASVSRKRYHAGLPTTPGQRGLTTLLGRPVQLTPTVFHYQHLPRRRSFR